MKITMEILRSKVNYLNYITKAGADNAYMLSKSNGYLRLMQTDVHGGQRTISYAMTKREMANALDMVINVITSN